MPCPVESDNRSLEGGDGFGGGFFVGWVVEHFWRGGTGEMGPEERELVGVRDQVG